MWVIAHRGASGYAPENTMAAFQRAVDLGAKFIETDLHVTRDGKVVAIHDSTLERTTNGRSHVHLKTLAELRTLDAGSWFQSPANESFSGQSIPTIEEILLFAKERDVTFYLEMKSNAAWGMEHAIVAALRDSEQASRGILLSFDPHALNAVHRLDSTLMTGFLCDIPSHDLIERALEAEARQILPRVDLVTPALVAAAHREGVAIVPWTVNDPERVRRLVDVGVNGIISDYPDRVLEALREASA